MHHFNRILSTFILFLTILVSNDAQKSQQAKTEESEVLLPHHLPIWTVLDPQTSIPCVRLQGQIEFQVSPEAHIGTNGPVRVPPTATVSGTCTSLHGDYQDIKLSWNATAPEDSFPSILSIYLGFSSGWESDYSDLSIKPENYALNSITIVYFGKSEHYSYPISYSISDFVAFLTPREKSYSCASITLHQGDLILNISSFRMEAFSENIEPVLFNDEFSCGDSGGENGGLKDEGGHMASIAGTMKWVIIGLFGVCAVGITISVVYGIMRQREEIKIIGYRIVNK